MKKLLLLFSLVFTLSAKAQTNVYHPFPDSNAVWCCSWGGGGGSLGWCGMLGQLTFQLDGKVTINNVVYNRLRHFEISQTLDYPWFGHICDSVISTYVDTTTYYIHQDTALKKVWIYDSQTMSDTILYNFDLHIGDTLDGSKAYWANGFPNYIITSIDSVLIGYTYRTRYNYNNGCYMRDTDTSMVEGIGSLHGLTKFPSCFEYFANLDKFIQDNHVYFGDTADLNCPSILLGYNEIKTKQTISFFPNPFHTTATLEIKNKEFSNAELKIYDRMGRLMQRQRINSQTITIHRNSLADGIYFYQLVNDGGKIISGRIAVE